MTTRIIVALVAITGCAEAPFAEGPSLDETCADIQGTAAGNGQGLELGRLQGSTFVPFVGGETLELSLNAEPYGWAFFAAARFGLESPPMQARDDCMGFQPGINTTSSPSLFLSPGHPAHWTEEPGSPGVGRWMTVGEARLVIGANLEPLLAMPLSIVVYATINQATSRSPDIMVKFTNNEGFLSN